MAAAQGTLETRDLLALLLSQTSEAEMRHAEIVKEVQAASRCRLNMLDELDGAHAAAERVRLLQCQLTDHGVDLCRTRDRQCDQMAEGRTLSIQDDEHRRELHRLLTITEPVTKCVTVKGVAELPFCAAVDGCIAPASGDYDRAGATARRVEVLSEAVNAVAAANQCSRAFCSRELAARTQEQQLRQLHTEQLTDMWRQQLRDAEACVRSAARVIVCAASSTRLDEARSRVASLEHRLEATRETLAREQTSRVDDLLELRRRAEAARTITATQVRQEACEAGAALHAEIIAADQKAMQHKSVKAHLQKKLTQLRKRRTALENARTQEAALLSGELKGLRDTMRSLREQRNTAPTE